MEALSHLQSILMENAFIVGSVLLFIILSAVAIWLWMASRSVKKSPVLENQAHINSAELGPDSLESTVKSEDTVLPEMPTDETS